MSAADSRARAIASRPDSLLVERRPLEARPLELELPPELPLLDPLRLLPVLRLLDPLRVLPELRLLDPPLLLEPRALLAEPPPLLRFGELLLLRSAIG
jgi:hypothetical protein